MKRQILLLALTVGMLTQLEAADTTVIANAVNSLGLDLYRAQTKEGANLLLSPYSIQIALAMTYAGADGDTRDEMRHVLHFPASEKALHDGFAALAQDLSKIADESVKRVAEGKKFGGPGSPIEFRVANRLFAQRGYEFRAPFLTLAKDRYHAPLDPQDFAHAAEKAREVINRWVEDQTKNKIRDLIPSGALDAATRLVLVNALYLRAPWASQFSQAATKPAPFLVRGRERVEVPTMVQMSACGFAARSGCKIVTRPYYGDELQFVIVLPDDPAGLPALEREITPKWLAECAKLESKEVILHLPKFRLEPPTIPLGENLKALGMKTAFDVPPGSANFDRMAPRKPNDYLCISAVLHKTFLALDEEGSEAAAATAVVMMTRDAMPVEKPKPIEIKVDHPFLFAIQHRASGACLFLGRVDDPR